MRHLVSAMLVIVALIHLMPLSGALGSERLAALYGVAFDEPNLSILMRHRAILFGVLGSFLLVAAFRPELQVVAVAIGFVSVVSFLYLAWSVGGYNVRIGRVVIADVVALLCLLVGAAALWYLRRPAATP
ncbi:MAG TPA: hypothetical protein VFP48_03765 [Steroidobacteraceae bacterium]|nr:hypothetical protein [Steroidobacteraceae bacterium]